MIIIIAVIIVLVLIISWVIFVPIIIYLDTRTGRYEVSQSGTFSVNFVPGGMDWIRFKIFGIRMRYSNSEKKRTRTDENKKKSTFKRPFHAWWQFVKDTLGSIKAKNVLLDIDTGDVVLNAKLIPIAYFITSNNRVALVNINFYGRVQGHLEAEIRIYNLLVAFIKFYI